MMRLAACLALLASGLQGQMPEYRTAGPLEGTVRVMGNSQMDKLVDFWEEGFHRYHPKVRFEKKYLGTANAIAGLYLEMADLALMGREILPIEDVAYRRAFPSGPLDIAVATASFNVPLETFAFAIFVNKENPIEKLTLAQLAAIFGCERNPGVRTWGDLGLKGEWAARPIKRHGYEISSGLGYFFQQKVLGGSHKWNCDFLRVVRRAAGRTKLAAAR
jgi:phosphate transport system substrate-binding protein